MTLVHKIMITNQQNINFSNNFSLSFKALAMVLMWLEEIGNTVVNTVYLALSDCHKFFRVSFLTVQLTIVNNP